MTNLNRCALVMAIIELEDLMEECEGLPNYALFGRSTRVLLRVIETDMETDWVNDGWFEWAMRKVHTCHEDCRKFQ
jgi:hypothetical protein